MKRYLGYFFLVFALISLAIAIKDLSTTKDSPEKTQNFNKGNHTAIILFRGSGFCPTCDIMEKLTSELFIGALSEDKASGAVIFTKINLEEPANEHFFYDYDLVTTSIVLSRIENGKETRWKNLADGWKLAETSPEAFKQYVEKETRQFETTGGIKR